MRTLILIPARAGSKGLPGKNVKVFNGKPLVAHTFEFAKKIAEANDIVCVTSNDDAVLSIANELDVFIPFKRPEQLSTDNASSYDVILHTINHFESLGNNFDNVLFLQPTSPFRCVDDYEKVKNLYTNELDMVVSVRVAKDNPYYNLFEQTEGGYLLKSKESNFSTRQQCPEIYAFNGAFYLINTLSVKRENISNFKRIVKSIMPLDRSVDIDTIEDWHLAEMLAKNAAY